MRSTAILTSTVVTLALAAPSGALAEGKPGDVHDPTLGQIAPADAAAKILRASEKPVVRAKPVRRARAKKGRRPSR